MHHFHHIPSRAVLILAAALLLLIPAAAMAQAQQDAELRAAIEALLIEVDASYDDALLDALTREAVAEGITPGELEERSVPASFVGDDSAAANDATRNIPLLSIAFIVAALLALVGWAWFRHADVSADNSAQQPPPQY